MMLYKTHLAEMLKLETLLKNVCAEKERLIHRLTDENKRLQARVDRLELIVLPHPKPTVISDKKQVGPIAAPAGETGWQSFLSRHVEEMEAEERKAKERVNGLSHEGRQAELYQPGSGAATRPNGGASAEASAS